MSTESTSKYFTVKIETDDKMTADKLHQLMCILFHETEHHIESIAAAQQSIMDIGEVLEVTEGYVA